MDFVAPRQQLSKQALMGFGGLAGGIGILVLKGIAAGSVFGGLAFGGILALSGLWLRASRHEKKAGTVGVAAGVLTILAALPVLKVFATPLMLIGGVGLLLVGGWSLYKLARGLRQR